MPTLKELVQGEVEFDFYRAGFLYYKCGTSEKFRFAVPVSDVGDASMMARDKGILYMRWIRKALEAGELERVL